MSKKLVSKTPEGAAIAAAVATLVASSGQAKKDVAADLGSDATELYQWETGRRPIPVDRAANVAARLGVAPESICARYREWLKAGGSIPPTPAEEAEVSKEVETLRFVLGVLATTMSVHRPKEAEAAAQALRKEHRGKYLRDEFVQEIVAMLEPQEKATQSASASSR